MADLFENHPTVIAELKKLWPLIRQTPDLIWQLLTKRPERIAESLPDDWGSGYPNVWLGSTVENNDYVWRADCLREIPTVCRFISYEPACGPIDAINLKDIHWLIFGGESGGGFRQHDPQWARDIRTRCQSEGVAFFYKQGSSLRSGEDETLDGEIYHAFPLGHVFAPNPEKKKKSLKVIPSES